MGKKIIITAGPTNERLDAVMQITNMSTGSLGRQVAYALLNNAKYDGQIDELWYLSPKLARKPEFAYGSETQVHLVEVTSAEDLLEKLTGLLSVHHIDAVVHSAAVGDYKGRYAVRAEDLVDEIFEKSQTEGPLTKEQLMTIFESPRAIQNNATKISSYEPHLMFMLGLTPKVISSIKKTSPSTKLIGFKLLEGVSEEELLSVAAKLRAKNDADYIVANDLSKIGNGRHEAVIINDVGVVTRCHDKTSIATTIAALIMEA